MIRPEDDGSEQPHVWMAFADLMAGLLGVFVLLFVWMVVFQTDLAGDLEVAEQARATAEQARESAEAAQARLALEKALEAERRKAAEQAIALERARVAGLHDALARSLAHGGISLSDDGRIGITGSVLFDLNQARLRPDGARILAEMGPPLAAWVTAKDEMVMVGGFTDDLPIHGERSFADNWELSSQRALTVVRALVAAGVPAERLFAAGFGAHHPAVPNADEASRARNRRVEIVPQRRTVRR